MFEVLPLNLNPYNQDCLVFLCKNSLLFVWKSNVQNIVDNCRIQHKSVQFHTQYILINEIEKNIIENLFAFVGLLVRLRIHQLCPLQKGMIPHLL